MWYDLTKSLLRCRQGRCKESLDALPPSERQRVRVAADSGFAMIHFVRAMCSQRLGDHEQASSALQKGMEHLKAAPAPGVDDLEREGAINVLMAHVLYRQAATLVSPQPESTH
jgi:hypothetical protein